MPEYRELGPDDTIERGDECSLDLFTWRQSERIGDTPRIVNRDREPHYFMKYRRPIATDDKASEGGRIEDLEALVRLADSAVSIMKETLRVMLSELGGEGCAGQIALESHAEASNSVYYYTAARSKVKLGGEK